MAFLSFDLHNNTIYSEEVDYNNVTYAEVPFYSRNNENQRGNQESPHLNKNDSVKIESESTYSTLPDEFTKVSPAQWPIIYAYSIVFIVASVGNLVEFIFVWRRLRKRSTAMNRLLLHLCIADLVVVFMVAAVEVVWRMSIGWYAGDAMCKLIQFFRAFGLYLSSLMLICLSLDRFYAVVFPLRVVDASRRIKIMLTVAWTTAAVCASPQCIVFQVRSHPEFPAFKQCNSILSGVLAEAINTAISMSFMYFFPILVIIFSYGNIIIKLAREADGSDEENSNRFLRRSGASVMDRAKIKTLKLSSVIVMVFIFCWTPYVVISIWHIVDRESAEHLNPYIQEALFIMVVSNSSVNPLVYGIFNTKKNHRRTQSTVSRNTMNESKRRTIIAQNRASVIIRNADLLPPKKRCKEADDHSPSENSPLNAEHRNSVTRLHIIQ